jgi:hypothetical protein
MRIHDMDSLPVCRFGLDLSHLGFFPKNVDGRIDDAAAGWKGSGLWSTYGTRAMFHLEGGTANRPRAVLQLRPDPLAH